MNSAARGRPIQHGLSTIVSGRAALLKKGAPVDVELRDLRWAVVASQHRSLRQAAQTLNVRQSTLSRRLRFIEDRLGAELFLRSNGGTHPTVAGLEFLDTARCILEDASAAFRKLKARSRGETGQLTVGCRKASKGRLNCSEGGGHRFESCRVRHLILNKRRRLARP